jgi:hypothetical protein
VIPGPKFAFEERQYPMKVVPDVVASPHIERGTMQVSRANPETIVYLCHPDDHAKVLAAVEECGAECTEEQIRERILKMLWNSGLD